MVENQTLVLQVDLSPIAKVGDIFTLQDGFVTNNEETIAIRYNSEISNYFKDEKG